MFSFIICVNTFVSSIMVSIYLSVNRVEMHSKTYSIFIADARVYKLTVPGKVHCLSPWLRGGSSSMVMSGNASGCVRSSPLWATVSASGW